MSKSDNRLFNIICYTWMAVLLFGLNITNQLTSPGLLLFAVVFFCLVDLVLERPWLGALIKTLVSLLLIHRIFYVGSIINLRWFIWLWTDLLNDWQFLFVRGYLNPSPVTGMVMALVVTALIQSLYYSLITRRKGVILLLFFGTFLLVWVSLWYQTSASLLIFLYVVMGLMIMGTVRLQQVSFEFSLYRWLSVLLVWALCLTSVAWVLPNGEADFYDWYQQAREVWEDFKERHNSGPSLRAAVGYGVYDDNLGQPLTNSFDMVFQVYSSVPLYLRGESRDFYTGRGWNDSIRALPLPHLPSRPTRLYYPSGITGQEMLITINVIQRQSRILFSPRYPMEFDFAGETPYFVTGEENNYGNYEFMLTRSLAEREAYQVKIFIPEDNSELLRTLSNEQADPRYLQLPRETPRRVRELAQQVSNQADNSYDRVVAILNHLITNYPYTLESERPPPGQDFVDHFLFTQGEGYCVHFSSALVVMARSLGIPARWVKGYSSGLKAADSYYITSGNAHSWVEVWFDDYGWVPFEPTPGYTRPNPTDGSNNPHPGGDNPGDGTNDPSPVFPDEPPPPDQPGNNPGPALGNLIQINVLLSVVLLLIVGLGLLAMAVITIRKGKGIIGAYAWLQSNLSWFGLERAVWETPREHLLRVSNRIPEPAVLEGFVDDFEKAVYGSSGEDQKGTIKAAYHSFSLLRLLRHRLRNK